MILRRDAKVKAISRVPLFANCSGRELAQIATLAEQVDLPEGKVLMREGEPGDEFFVLVEGTADVKKEGKRRASKLEPGDFAGEIALLANAPRTATVQTTSPVTALRLKRRGFLTLLEESPGLQRKVLKSLAERLAPNSL